MGVAKTMAKERSNNQRQQRSAAKFAAISARSALLLTSATVLAACSIAQAKVTPAHELPQSYAEKVTAQANQALPFDEYQLSPWTLVAYEYLTNVMTHTCANTGREKSDYLWFPQYLPESGHAEFFGITSLRDSTTVGPKVITPDYPKAKDVPKPGATKPTSAQTELDTLAKNCPKINSHDGGDSVFQQFTPDYSGEVGATAQAALGDWQSCMAEAGINVPLFSSTNADLAHPALFARATGYSSGVTDPENAKVMAHHDVRCKVETDFVNRWRPMIIHWQESQIEAADKTELEQVRLMTKRVRTVLALTAPPTPTN